MGFNSPNKETSQISNWFFQNKFPKFTRFCSFRSFFSLIGFFISNIAAIFADLLAILPSIIVFAFFALIPSIFCRFFGSKIAFCRTKSMRCRRLRFASAISFNIFDGEHPFFISFSADFLYLLRAIWEIDEFGNFDF